MSQQRLQALFTVGVERCPSEAPHGIHRVDVVADTPHRGRVLLVSLASRGKGGSFDKECVLLQLRDTLHEAMCAVEKQLEGTRALEEYEWSHPDFSKLVMSKKLCNHIAHMLPQFDVKPICDLLENVRVIQGVSLFSSKEEVDGLRRTG